MTGLPHRPVGAPEIQDVDFRSTVINLDRPGDPSVFGEQTRAEAANLIARYPAGQARSALLPLLHLVQSEQGYVTPDGIAFCADTLGLTKAQVAAVSSFYTMYKRRPTGEYLVSVCTNTLCGMLGGDEIYAALCDGLGIGDNETTDDGAVTIEHAECLAACDYAPVVTVNYEFFDNQTVGSTQELVRRLRAGERPMPTRGAPLCTFKQTERMIAGFFTDDDQHLDAPATGTPTEAGVQLAIQRGDTAPSYAADSAAPAPDAREGQTTLFEAHRDEAPDATGEFPLETETSERDEQAAGRRRPRPSSGRTVSGASAEETSNREGPSESDAPLHTAESDPANPTAPGAEKED